MKKIKGIAILAIAFLTNGVYAQTTQSSGNAKLKTEAEKAHVERKSKPNLKQESKPAGSTDANLAVQLDENDPYQGRKKEFENMFSAKQLPADFPLYHKSYGIRGYNQVIDNYCAGHLNILTQQLREKIQGHP